MWLTKHIPKWTNGRNNAHSGLCSGNSLERRNIFIRHGGSAVLKLRQSERARDERKKESRHGEVEQAAPGTNREGEGSDDGGTDVKLGRNTICVCVLQNFFSLYTLGEISISFPHCTEKNPALFRLKSTCPHWNWEALFVAWTVTKWHEICFFTKSETNQSQIPCSALKLWRIKLILTLIWVSNPNWREAFQCEQLQTHSLDKGGISFARQVPPIS